MTHDNPRRLSDSEYDACKKLCSIARFSADDQPPEQTGHTIRESLTKLFSREYAHYCAEDEPTETRTSTTNNMVDHYSTDEQWRNHWDNELAKKGYSDKALGQTRGQLQADFFCCCITTNTAEGGAISCALDHFSATLEADDFRARMRAIDDLNPQLLKLLEAWLKQGYTQSDLDLLR